MKRYYVEGLFIPLKSLKKVQKGAEPSSREVEPFARSFWADDPSEALRQATEAIAGGRWLEPPKVSLTSEEQRMRQAGAPELPGFGQSNSSSVRRKGKTSQP
jgi:hypothetical protein